MKNRLSSSAITTLGAMLLLGCGRTASPDEVAIRAVVQEANQALMAGDRDAALSHYVPSAESESFVDAASGFFVAAREFRDRLVEHHGEEGLEEFNAAPGFTVRVDDTGQDDDAVVIRIDGDRATVTTPGRERTSLLVREGDAWRFSSPTRDEVALILDQLVPLTRVLEANLETIGDPSVSPASLSRAMGDQVGLQVGETFVERYSPLR